MNTKTIPLTLNKKVVDLAPLRMAMYKQSKIIEAIDKKQNSYYLFFYKCTYLTAVKATSMKINSHLKRAFTSGIVIDGHHPIVTKLLENQQTFTLIRFNPLFKKVSQKYTPLEKLLIFTFFDAFIPFTELNKLFKSTYYKFRRNGQLYASFRVLKAYQQHDPTDPFAKDMLNNMQFQPYEIMYQDIKKVTSKDPIYVESVCFQNLDNEAYVELLCSLYQSQGRYIDEIAIRLYAQAADTSLDLAKLQTLLSTHFEEVEQINIVTTMMEAQQQPETQSLLLSLLLNQDNPTTLVDYLVRYDLKPEQEQLELIATSFKQVDTKIFPTLFHSLNHKLLELFKDDHPLLENLINRSISSFFKHYDINQLLDWLKPFVDAGIHLPIEQKLNKIKTLQEDPDQQYALGELYVNFNQPEMSIDCFKWEMELNPNDPRPVQSLLKVYHELGDKTEAQAYQQLLIQMQK